VEGGIRIMAARDNLMVMYINVKLLVVKLQKTDKNGGQTQQHTNKKKYYRFDRVCLCKYVCKGDGGRNEGIVLSPVCIPVLCCAINFDLSNALLKLLKGAAATI
jgi:hypothetical protein